MSTHWEPETWADFCRAYRSGSCRVVVYQRARAWAKEQGWKTRWFRFEDQFLERLLESESTFQEAYSANVFALYERRPRDLKSLVTE